MSINTEAAGQRRWQFPPAGRAPLTGLRVLDFSTFGPGPFATQIMTDLGATVIKVEKVGGEVQRHTVPEFFRALNRGKSSLELNLKDPGDNRLCRRLAAGADVLVESFRPGAMDRLGLGAEAVAEANPALVYVSIPPFAQSGAGSGEQGHETQFNARSGAFVDPGGAMHEPPPAPFSDLGSGAFAVIGTLAALGQGDRHATRVGVPVLGAAVSFMFMRLLRELNADTTVDRPWRSEPAAGPFPTGGNGFIAFSAVDPKAWGALVELLDEPRLRAPEFADYASRQQRIPEVNALITARLAADSQERWLERFRSADIPVAPANRAQDVFEDPFVQALGILERHPAPHVRLPINGIPSVTNIHPPELDDCGAAVREHGWRALESE
ncbi:CaiB/BaiF CoA transferase family protein [Streptomyces chartreusis]|uniref:CaiB/BaiF CoA transferase family protein n=1 Tax=Streptomyces chartreusis TaxID=1969 RepID=UPI003641BD06